MCVCVREREVGEKETPSFVVLWTQYAVVCGPVRKREREKTPSSVICRHDTTFDNLAGAQFPLVRLHAPSIRAVIAAIACSLARAARVDSFHYAVLVAKILIHTEGESERVREQERVRLRARENSISLSRSLLKARLRARENEGERERERTLSSETESERGR